MDHVAICGQGGCRGGDAVGWLSSAGGPFAADGHEFTVEPIRIFVCDMVSSINANKQFSTKVPA